MKPHEELAEAARLLRLEGGFRDGELTEIVLDWLDLETEVLACRTPAAEIVDLLPSVRLARWVRAGRA